MATYTGTSGNDSLNGGSSDDVLSGFEGNDTLAAKEGNDILIGGAGNDTLYGESGTNTAVFSGNLADYKIYNDLYKFTVTDNVADRDGVDTAYSIWYFQFADQTVSWTDYQGYNVSGGDGNDTLIGTPLAEIMNGGAGNDSVIGGDGVDSIGGGPGNDTLIGGSDNDIMDGWTGDDSLLGGDGDDMITPGEGADHIDGGSGLDAVTYASHATAVVANLLTGIATTATGDDILVSIESVAGTNYNDSLIGDNNANRLSGQDGIDTLVGGAGNDSLYGGKGSDTAVFSGLRSEYTIGYDDATTTYFVMDRVNGRDGIDIVRDTESFSFSDGTVASSSAVTSTTPTAGSDVLPGTAGADTLSGLAGADTLDGLAGNDSLNGGSGNDALCGSAGNDTLEGGGGNDRLYGEADSDTAVYTGARDEYEVSYDSETATYTIADLQADRDGTDTAQYIEYFQFENGTVAAGDLLGGDGDQELFGTSGNDTMSGGAGNDTLHGDAGHDLLLGLDGDDVVNGGADMDYLYGGDGNDALAGGAGNDSLYGGMGDDSLNGGLGNDVIDGGGGSDWGMFNGDEGGVVIDLDAGTATGGDGDDALIGIENIFGSSGNDLVTGDEGDNIIISLNGDDTLAGGGGNDFLRGWDGIDTIVFSGERDDYEISYDADSEQFLVIDLVADRDGTDIVYGEWFQFSDGTIASFLYSATQGTAGNDTLVGTSGDDALLGMAGNDSLYGGKGADWLEGGAGNDTLNGADGTDTASYESAIAAVRVSLGSINVQATGGAGNDLLTSIENLRGSDWSDVLTGNALANSIEGGAGNDTLNGGAGADALAGGDGDDRYVVDNLSDAVSEVAGEGTDTVESLITFTLGVNVENLVLGGKLAISGFGSMDSNVLLGNAAFNVLSGGMGNDLLDGGKGADQLYGGKGDDTFVVDVAGDLVVENGAEGTDTVQALLSHTLAANVENLVLAGKAANGTGNAGDNVVTGNAGKNVLNGAAGNDVLDGGLGADLLTGGAGADVFVFSTALAKNIDKIMDFNAADDSIHLDNAVFAALGDGALPSAAFQSAASSVAATADVRIIFNTATGALLYDADGIGGVAAVPFAMLVLVGLAGPLTADNFETI